MSEKGFFVRLPEHLLERLEQYSRETGKPKAQVVAEAIQAYLKSGGKEEKTAGLRLIALKFPAKCVKCDKEMQVGDLAYWSTGVVVCVECYAKQTAGVLPETKQLYRLYKEIRRLKALKAEAQRDLDALMSQVEKLDVDARIAELIPKLEEVVSQLFDYMNRVESNVQLEEVKQHLMEIIEKIDEIRAVKSLQLRKRRTVAAEV